MKLNVKDELGSLVYCIWTNKIAISGSIHNRGTQFRYYETALILIQLLLRTVSTIT